ncbi:MAG: SAM-dependent methyltransferase, partial [Patescibacteria group bacterium]
EQNGFRILDARNRVGSVEFYDVGAIVFFLKNIPWIVEGFSVKSHLSSLEKLQKKIDEGRQLRYTIGRFLIKVAKNQ